MLNWRNLWYTVKMMCIYGIASIMAPDLMQPWKIHKRSGSQRKFLRCNSTHIILLQTSLVSSYMYSPGEGIICAKINIPYKYPEGGNYGP